MDIGWLRAWRQRLIKLSASRHRTSNSSRCQTQVEALLRGFGPLGGFVAIDRLDSQLQRLPSLLRLLRGVLGHGDEQLVQRVAVSPLVRGEVRSSGPAYSSPPRVS